MNALTLRLFIGVPITPELRMHLNKSHAWQQAQIIPSLIEELKAIYHQDQEYLGYYCDQNSLTLGEIRHSMDFIQGKMQVYCPSYPLENTKILIFPQVFVA